MAGDLAPLGEDSRLVAEHQPAECDLRGDEAAEPGGWRRVVVAGDPDPVGGAAEGRELAALFFVETVGRIAVVKRIAERNDPPGRPPCNHRRHPPQSRAGVIRRQELAAHRIERPFLEMNIGEDERSLVRPPQRAGRVEYKRLAVHVDVGIV